MRGQDITTLAITFAMGFVAGVYLYFSGFAPQFLTGGDTRLDQYESLTIVAEVYGGCERDRACPSFQVIGDGTYSYLGDSSSAPVTGSLSRLLQRQAFSALTADQLRVAARASAAVGCSSYVDGNDVLYEITLNSVVYELDTCYTSLSEAPELAVALDKLWEYFLIYE